MSYLNQSLLCGHLGVNPVLVTTTERGKFVRLSLATNKRYTDAYGELKEDRQWHTVYLNGAAADYASEHARTGHKVYVSGELRKRKWTNKKTGEERYETAVYARDFQLLTPISRDDISTPDEEAYSTENSNVTETIEEQTKVAETSMPNRRRNKRGNKPSTC